MPIDSVTWELFAWVIGGVVSAGLVVLGLGYRASNLLHARISRVSSRLDDFRVEAAGQFVTIGHLNEVEMRLMEEGRSTRRVLEGLTVAIARLEERLSNMSDRQQEDRDDRKAAGK